MKTSASNSRLRKLLSQIKAQTLIPNPEFQRRLVWANKHKVAFIQTVLDQLPFPEIYTAAGEVNLETGEGKEILVDGQQRITTLYQYFSGSEDLKYEGGLKKYSDLNPEEQEAFLEYEVVIRDLGKLPIEVIKDVFKRINSTNYSLNAVEVHNARFDGAIKKFADEVSSNKFFEEHRVFTNNDIKRMRDLGFALVVIITMQSTYFNLESEFEDFLEKYNDNFPQEEELRTQIEELFQIIDSLNFAEDSRAFKKSDLFTLLVELHRYIFKENFKLDLKKLETNLKEFYSMVERNDPLEYIQNYSKAVIQGTNNRSSRIIRGDIIGSIITNSVLLPTLNGTKK